MARTDVERRERDFHDDRYDDRYLDDRRASPAGERSYGGDPRRMEHERYTGLRANERAGSGYTRESRVEERADRDDRSGPYAHGGVPGGQRWRSGYGNARGSGRGESALPGEYGHGPGGSAAPQSPQSARWPEAPQARLSPRAGPRNYTRSDERIREDLCERLSYAGHLDVREVEVNVADGWVKLSGTVPARPQKYRIEDIAASVYGVKDVENRIRVLPGTGDTGWTEQPGEPDLTGQPGQQKPD